MLESEWELLVGRDIFSLFELDGICVLGEDNEITRSTEDNVRHNIIKHIKL
jgi:hypothetical protein